MKTTKINHSEILNRLNAEYNLLIEERESARKVWMANTDRDLKMELYYRYHAKDVAIKNLEREIRFHTIMLQDKKYATEWLWSDAHAYEIIEEKTDKMILVRRMKATIKPEAQKALQDSFVPGGFCGHFDNNLQEWEYESDESNPIETIRKRKDGCWYGCGCQFTIEPEPHEHYDYNF